MPKRKAAKRTAPHAESVGPAPATPDELHAWLRRALRLNVSRRPMVEGHAAPFDYLCWSYFNCLTPPTPDQPADCVVWACRGGGKTFLGAVATLLDLTFRPGIEVRVLGGSLDQSKRMYTHLRRFLDPARFPALAAMVRGRVTERRVAFTNGSEVELLCQSQTSVRGTRVQKLRCDEVDLFDPEVWTAAQLTTRERVLTPEGGHPFTVHGSIECLSTMHLSHGVMNGLIKEAREGSRRLFRWNLADVLAVCPTRHTCHAPGEGGVAAPGTPRPCPLWGECRGRAKDRHAERAGHVSIDDALSLKRRVPLSVWESEMLCRRPARLDRVLPEFDTVAHVFGKPDDDPSTEPRAVALRADARARWLAGMDFGVRTTVVLWAALDEEGVLWVLDERAGVQATTHEHAAAIKAGLARPGVPPWPAPAYVAIDPAGESTNSQTGKSDASVLSGAGLRPRAARAGVATGLNLVRTRLRAADGSPPRLFVHARCTSLLESMERFRYRADSDQPEKGRFDHAVDALRYLVVSVDKPAQSKRGVYAP
jgi:hypothetical protein